MKKIFDNIFFTSFELKHVRHINVNIYKRNKKWQCIAIPNNFELEYETLLDKSKKILILGDWRRNAKWFRFLKSRNYRVYLEKKRKEKK